MYSPSTCPLCDMASFYPPEIARRYRRWADIFQGGPGQTYNEPTGTLSETVDYPAPLGPRGCVRSYRDAKGGEATTGRPTRFIAAQLQWSSCMEEAHENALE